MEISFPCRPFESNEFNSGGKGYCEYEMSGLF